MRHEKASTLHGEIRARQAAYAQKAIILFKRKFQWNKLYGGQQFPPYHLTFDGKYPWEVK